MPRIVPDTTRHINSDIIVETPSGFNPATGHFSHREKFAPDSAKVSGSLILDDMVLRPRENVARAEVPGARANCPAISLGGSRRGIRLVTKITTYILARRHYLVVPDARRRSYGNSARWQRRQVRGDQRQSTVHGGAPRRVRANAMTGSSRTLSETGTRSTGVFAGGRGPGFSSVISRSCARRPDLYTRRSTV